MKPRTLIQLTARSYVIAVIFTIEFTIKAAQERRNIENRNNNENQTKKEEY